MNDSKVYPKIGVAVFVWRGDKFVIQERLGSHGEGTWSIPGGHLEFGESWEECGEREVREETGMKITNIRFLAATNDVFTKEGKHYATIWLEADWLANEPSVKEPDRVGKIVWTDFHHLPSPLFEPCWQHLKQAKPELFS